MVRWVKTLRRKTKKTKSSQSQLGQIQLGKTERHPVHRAQMLWIA